MAKEKGFFKNNGIDLTITVFGTAQQIPLAVAAGKIDVGLTGLSAGFFNLAGQGRLKIIAGALRQVNNWPTDVYVVSNKVWSQGVRDPSQIKNISFGINEVGSTLHYMMGLLLKKQMYPDDCLKVVPLGNVAGIKSALATEQVDSAILPPLAAYPLIKEKSGHIVGFVSKETPFQAAVVFSNIRLLQDRRELLVRLLKGFFQGYELYHRIFNGEQPENYDTYEKLSKNKERYNSAIIMSQYLQTVTPFQISSHPMYMDPEGKLDIESIKKQLRWYQQKNMVNKGISIKDIIDWEMVKTVNAAEIK